MTPLELVVYYQSLLIIQYATKPKAVGTIGTLVTPALIPQTSVQTVALSAIPTSGTFTVTYGGLTTSDLNWNDSASTIQTAIRGLPGLAAVVVTGSLASKLLTVTFMGVRPVADLLEVDSALLISATPITVTVIETDETLPLAVQDGFNVTGSSTAIGAQLDVIGKYVGVTRTAQGFTDQITLTDYEFITLIQFAIIKNSSGSSLADIVGLVFQFFGTNIQVYDYTDMFMTYYISSVLVSSNTLQLLVNEGLLPKPMAVGDIIVLFDGDDAFAFDGATTALGFGDTGDPLVGGKLATLFA